ncbi:MAG: response regulator [Lachnospiraceae bacterium]|nr:response regulator [Lachnospiraceae bacterium]
MYLLSFRDKNRESSRSYKLFRNLEIVMLLALAGSILTYTFAKPELGTPLSICTLLRTMDSIMCVMASRLFAVYLMEYVDSEGRMKTVSMIGNILFLAYLILMILNLPLKFILWYTPEGAYIHSSLFVPIVFTAPIYYLISGILMLIFRLKTLGPREKVSLSIASFVTLFGTIIQAATNGVILLSLPFGSIGIFVLYFSIETSDYHQLLKNNEILRLAEQDAVKANRAKSDFLASMSHEIRTPLNAVLGMDELILIETDKRKDIDPSFTGLIKEYAENIRDAGQVLLSVINDILDLTKIESGKMDLKPEPYILHDMINDVSNMVRVRAEQKGLSYEEKVDPAIPGYLIGDELRIRQIMINLLNNAVKYTESGQVELEMGMKDLTENSLSLCIRVKDSGIGIKEENIPLIFGDFQRLDEGDNHKIEGTGLGLSIVKRMITLMNGSIDVSSKFGEGSVFTVVLPQEISSEPIEKRADNEKSSNPADAITFRTPDCRYLIVDDNKLNILVAKRFLSGLCGHTDAVLSGEKALYAMRKKKYDLIFMDHMMPELNGIQTYEKSLNDPENLNMSTPVIMMTANALSGVRDEYLDKGFADYISKPVDIKELMRVVALHLPEEKIVRE